MYPCVCVCIYTHTHTHTHEQGYIITESQSWNYCEFKYVQIANTNMTVDLFIGLKNENLSIKAKRDFF